MDAKVVFSKGDLLTPEQSMWLAMEVATEGAPYVSPNPVVGCVIVDRDHKLLATGFHPKFGLQHAEIDALKKVSESELEGATFYVTLEPCAHEGKTGSCAKKLATLKIKKVVYGLVDPNPLVKGAGAQILIKAGIEAIEYQGPLKSDLEQLCEIFLKNYLQKKIFIAAKVATSLDGQIALRSGESKWITSAESREYVHELRSYYDAIVVGANTIQLDDPSLTIRHPKIQKQTRIIILDSENKLFEQKRKIFELHKQENIIFAVKRKNLKNSYRQIEFTDLYDLAKNLWDLQIRSLFIEGGSQTYSSFLNAELVDRLYLFMAPNIIGSKNGLSWTSQVAIDSLKNKIQLDKMKTRSFGPDIFLTARLLA